jgi:hypothetical protein
MRNSSGLDGATKTTKPLKAISYHPRPTREQEMDEVFAALEILDDEKAMRRQHWLSKRDMEEKRRRRLEPEHETALDAKSY